MSQPRPCVSIPSSDSCGGVGRGRRSRRVQRRKRDELDTAADGDRDDTDSGGPLVDRNNVACPPETINDLAGMDVASYLASVRRQAGNFPGVLVGSGAGKRFRVGEKGGGAKFLSKAAVRTNNKERRGMEEKEEGKEKDGSPSVTFEEEETKQQKQKPPNQKQQQQKQQQQQQQPPIDGSAATLAVMLSPCLSLPSPPTPLHLPARGAGWVKVTLSNFQSLRTYLSELKNEEDVIVFVANAKKDGRRAVPPMKDRGGWHEFCLGKDEAMGNVGGYYDDDDDGCGGYGSTSTGSDEEKADGGDESGARNRKGDSDSDGDGTRNGPAANVDEKDQSDWSRTVPPSGHSPTSSLLLRFDQVLVRRLLSHHAHFLLGGWDLTTHRAAWIYGLLARLELPVHRDDAAVLRGILRECCRRRADFDLTRGKMEDLAALNTLIATLGIYFGQGGGMELLFVSSVQSCSVEPRLV